MWGRLRYVHSDAFHLSRVSFPLRHIVVRQERRRKNVGLRGVGGVFGWVKNGWIKKKRFFLDVGPIFRLSKTNNVVESPI